MEQIPQSQSGVDLFLNAGSRKIPLSILVVFASTLAFLWLIFPLFDPGPPINSDIGVHYSAIACYLKGDQWNLQTAWCDHGQAGLARFSRYAVVHAYVTVFLSWFMPLEVAFKVMMVLGFLLLPTVSYFFLSWLGYPLAGAIAFTIFAFEPGGVNWGGYWLHFVVGGFINSMATGFSLLTLFCILWMHSSPSYARIVLTSATGAVYFLSHPSSALWLPIALVPIAILYRREIWKYWRMLLWTPVFFVLFISFWLLPALIVSPQYTTPGLGGFVDFDFSGFFTRFAIQVQWLVFFAMASVVVLLFRPERNLKLIGCITLAIPIAWFLSNQGWGGFYLQFFSIDRSMYELRTFLFLSASLVAGGVHPKIMSQMKKPLLVAALVLLIILLAPLYTYRINASSVIFTGQDIEPIIIPIFKFVENATGRIIAENTYLQFPFESISVTQPWSLSAVYSNNEFLGNSDFWYLKTDYSIAYKDTIFKRNLLNYTDEELQALLWGLNVQYIWTFSSFGDRFKGRMEPAPGYNGTFGSMYQTPWNPSFFYLDSGSLVNATYTTTAAKVVTSSGKQGSLLFKVRNWPNWMVAIDGIPSIIRDGPLGLMVVEVPPGNHVVEFKYGTLLVEYIGFAVTLFGLLLSLFIIYYSRKEDAHVL